MTTKVSVKKVADNEPQSVFEEYPHEANIVRFDLKQAIIDDGNEEQHMITHIISRSNAFYRLVTDLHFHPKEDKITRQSMQTSMKREASNITRLLDQFLEARLLHTEKQHAIVKRFKKLLKKKI